MSKIVKKLMHQSTVGLVVISEAVKDGGMNHKQMADVSNALAKPLKLAVDLSDKEVNSSLVTTFMTATFEATPDIFIVTCLQENGQWHSACTLWPEGASQPDRVVRTYISNDLQELERQTTDLVASLYMDLPFDLDFLHAYAFEDMDYLTEAYEACEAFIMDGGLNAENRYFETNRNDSQLTTV